MGDSGSLSLGATLAVIALITGQILVLPLIGLIFVVETASVIIQVAYFKLTGGKRLFRMAPLHHHFELAGWDEEKITLRFWIVGVLAGLLGVTLFLASIRQARSERTMTTERPIDLDALTLDACLARRAARTGPWRCSASPGAASRWPASSPTRARASRSTTAGRPSELGRRDRGRSRAGTSRSSPGPDVDPASALGRRGARRDVAVDQRPTTRRPSRACAPRSGRSSARGRRRRDGARRSSPRPTCSCGSARRRRSASPARRARRRRRRSSPRSSPADPGHPVVLGGNIGIPLVERLPELTPDHRVVIELSELQLPTLSRGARPSRSTRTSPPTTSTATGRSRPTARSKRRLAELVDPDGALVLNAEDPVVGGVRGPRAARRRRSTGSTARCRAASASSTAGSSPRACERLPHRGRRDRRRPAPAGRILPLDELAIPGAPQRLATRSRRSPSGLLFGVAPDAIRRGGRRLSRASSTASRRSRSSTACGSSTTRRARSRTRSSPPLRAFEPPVVLIAGGRDKGVDLDRAGAGRRGAGRRPRC